MDVRLEPLIPSDEEQFIRDNQVAFNYGAAQYFNEQELINQQEDDGQVISRKTILDSIHHEFSQTYRIIYDNKKVGGLVLNLINDFGELELFFVLPEYESKGIGQAAWKEVEKLYPKIKTWITHTPYFEKRNIHFYVNKLGFHIIEFENHFNEEVKMPDELDGMFTFKKEIQKK